MVPTPDSPAELDADRAFEQRRPRLFGLAYRMLGTRADAEDAVQDAYLRWHDAERSTIRNVDHWLATVVARLCIDRLRRVATERAAYAGSWLPEPLPPEALPPDAPLERALDLSIAFVALLERLRPEERAAFLLRELFDVPYPELAALLGKSEAMCRQMVHRAHARVQEGRPRRAVAPDVRRRLLERFLTALQRDDADALLATFAEDVAFTSDGGGKVFAARHVIAGRARVCRLMLSVHRKWGATYRHALGSVNGEPALIARRLDGSVYSVTTLAVDGERITGVFRILNPDKLRSLQASGWVERRDAPAQ